MNVTLPRAPTVGSSWPSPGTWIFLRAGGEGTEPTARVSCADCGSMASISDHSIDADGKVTPSVVCPDECGWHVDVTLEGWAETIA